MPTAVKGHPRRSPLAFFVVDGIGDRAGQLEQPAPRHRIADTVERPHQLDGLAPLRRVVVRTRLRRRRAVGRTVRQLVEEEIGSAHVCTPVTNAHLVCRLLREQKKKNKYNADYIENTHTQTTIYMK